MPLAYKLKPVHVLTVEQRQKGRERVQKTTSDSAYADKMMAEVQAAFDAADDDKDGFIMECCREAQILSSGTMRRSLEQSAKERGSFFPDYTDDMTKEMWRVFN